MEEANIILKFEEVRSVYRKRLKDEDSDYDEESYHADCAHLDKAKVRALKAVGRAKVGGGGQQGANNSTADEDSLEWPKWSKCEEPWQSVTFRTHKIAVAAVRQSLPESEPWATSQSGKRGSNANNSYHATKGGVFFHIKLRGDGRHHVRVVNAPPELDLEPEACLATHLEVFWRIHVHYRRITMHYTH